jgi:hypothetical protein
MDRLADMIESALDRHGSKNIRTMLGSDEWRDIQARYNEVRTELLVQGHTEVLKHIKDDFDKLQDKLAEVASQDNPPKLKDVYLFWDMSFCATLRAMASIRPALKAHSRVQAATELPKPKASAVPPKRSWTQADLDDAIRTYKAKRAASFEQYVSLLDDPATPAGRKRRIRKEAAAMFGRNVIAKALGVKSAKMVSQSQPWVRIAEALGLPRRSARTAIPGKPKTRIGEEIAAERASMAATDTDEYAAADAALLRAEREETLRQIRMLAESELRDAKPQAKALFDRYEAGEMTDEQVRQTVELLMEPA